MRHHKAFSDYLLFEEYRLSSEALGLYRIGFAAVYLIILGVPSFAWLSQVAEFFYAPQMFNVARLLSDYVPRFEVLLLLDVVIAISLGAMLFGFKTKLVSWLLTLTLLVGFAFQYSLGKIDHNIILVLIPAVMSFSGWEQAFSIDAQAANRPSQPPDGYAPFVMALVLGFAMFTAGVPKLLGGWLSWDASGMFHHFYSRYYFWDRQTLLAPLLAGDTPHWIWKAMDYTAVLFELLFLPAVFNKRVFQGFCCLAVAFHVVNLLILNITFSGNLLAYLLFIRWQPVIAQLKQWRIPERLERLMTYRNFALTLLFLMGQYYWCVYAGDVRFGFRTDSSLLEALTKLVGVRVSYLGSIALIVISLFVMGWQLIIRHHLNPKLLPPQAPTDWSE